MEPTDWRELPFLHKKWLPSFRKELKSQGKTSIHQMPDGIEKTHFQFMTDELKEVFTKQHNEMKANGLMKDVIAMEKIYEKACKSLDALGVPRVKKTFMARSKSPKSGRGRGTGVRGRGRGRGRSTSSSVGKRIEDESGSDEEIFEEEGNDVDEPAPLKRTKSQLKKATQTKQSAQKNKQVRQAEDTFDDDDGDGTEL